MRWLGHLGVFARGLGNLSGSLSQHLSESLILVWLLGFFRPPYCTILRGVIHIIVNDSVFRPIALSLGLVSLSETSEIDNCQLQFGTEFHSLDDIFNHLWCKAGTKAD